jgi:uncharacterized protein (TIGR02246 family)
MARPHTTGGNAVDPDPARDVRRTTLALLDAMNASSPDGVLAVWAEDGVLMPPHHPAVRGAPAIAAYFRDLFARAALRFSFSSSEVLVSGDLAVERVTYRASMQPRAGGPATGDEGKGLHVLRRQADGSWRLIQDLWNSDRPAPAARA